MPDLSHRPSRYATIAVVVLALGAAGYAQADVSVGGKSELQKTAEQNAELRAERAALEAKLKTAAAPSCDAYPSQEDAQAVFVANPSANRSWDGDRDGVACEQLKSSAAAAVAPGAEQTCAAFGTQEDAQKAFAADPVAHPSWDGDGDGEACEQLKSGVAPKSTTKAGTKPPTVTAGAASPAAHAPAAAPAEEEEDSTPSGYPTPPPSETPPVTEAPITAFTKAEIVSSTKHFGLYAATTEEYDAVEATLAKDSTIRGYFQGFDTNFRPERVTSAWQRGEIPMLTWESRPLNTVADETPYSLGNIVAGGWDAYLTQYAKDIAATGLPLIIRFDHEMNGTWYRWSEGNSNFGNAKGSYVAAWRHIHDIFTANGANDYVIWDWAPNRVGPNDDGWTPISQFYPGDEYVDWVGMTGYLRKKSDTPTFSAVFDKTLGLLREVAPGKPILLSETGATETGGNKLGYVNDFFASIGNNPDVVGFVWFNYAVSEKGATNDWRITSTTAVTTAFREGLYATGYGRDRGKTPYLTPAGQ